MKSFWGGRYVTCSAIWIGEENWSPEEDPYKGVMALSHKNVMITGYEKF